MYSICSMHAPTRITWHALSVAVVSPPASHPNQMPIMETYGSCYTHGKNAKRIQIKNILA